MTEFYMDLMIGVLAIILGYITMKNNLGKHIIFVNEKKYDTNKVSKIAGTHILAYGIIDCILVVARYFTKGSEIGGALNKASIVVVFAIGALMYYNIRKNCKIEKTEEDKVVNYKKKKKKKKKKKR